jgi:hypothetical protein
MVARDMRRGTVRDLSGRGRARRRAAQGEAIAVETSAIGAGRMLRGELSDDGGGAGCRTQRLAPPHAVV